MGRKEWEKGKWAGKAPRLLSALLALAVWQVGALLLNQPILLAPPGEVLARLVALCFTGGFWLAVGFSFTRILTGFFAALLIGTVLGIAGSRLPLIDILLWPYIAAIKSAPVASFIILCLIWLSAANLSIFIAFLMVLPVIYNNVRQGILGTDPQLLEMAAVFRLGFGRRLLFIYLPQLKPYVVSACGAALGMSWKAGVAAEVIGIPTGSIGERLYEAKVHLLIPDLFAWTAVVILASVLFEKLLLAALRKAYDRLEKI
ncbi:MAG: ABC transporter permease subunit [Peptococcaceae bacterium]|jgi:NitT/TauT family transport system permease protein|nr:ABC transporter permease subunit [Peptococcaceae bacterium]